MRLGIVLAGFTALPAAELIAAAREAEARGYHTAWLGEVAGYDAIVMSTVVATHTERLVVANGVLPVQTRTPVILGMATASLNHLAPGRFALGLGLSSRTIVEQWHGLAFSPALGQIREAVAIVRKVAAGERVNHEGAFYRVKNFRLTGPAPKAPVRVYLAALGPEMLELAGEIADGVLLNWIPPEAVAASVAHLEAGAGKAGRTLDGFEIASFVRTCVTDDAAAARETLARDITGYATVDVYASFFRDRGLPGRGGGGGRGVELGRPGRRRQARLAAHARRPRRGRRRGLLPGPHRRVRRRRRHPAGDRALRAGRRRPRVAPANAAHLSLSRCPCASSA